MLVRKTQGIHTCAYVYVCKRTWYRCAHTYSTWGGVSLHVVYMQMHLCALQHTSVRVCAFAQWWMGVFVSVHACSCSAHVHVLVSLCVQLRVHAACPSSRREHRQEGVGVQTLREPRE